MAIELSASQPHRLHPQKVQVFDEFHEPQRLRGVYETLRAAAIWDGLFWTEADKIRRHRAGDREPVAELAQYFGAETAAFCYDHFVKLVDSIPRAEADALKLVEFWVKNFRPNARVVGLHIDNANSPDGARTPIWSTILHVGPERPIQGGETALCMEDPIPPAILQRSHTGCMADEARKLSNDWIDVPQKFNRCIAFRGDLPHYVAPVRAVSNPGDSRVSLLVNLMDYRAPTLVGNSPCLLSVEDFATLRKLDESVLFGLFEAARVLTDEEAVKAIASLRRLFA